MSLQKGMKGACRGNWSLAVTEGQKCLELPRYSIGYFQLNYYFLQFHVSIAKVVLPINFYE